MTNKISTHKLKSISSEKDIPEYLLNTPVAKLLKYHNLSTSFKEYERAEVVVVMCMDNRKQLNTPKRFAYILRTAGARITGYEFMLSFSIGFAGIKHVALIGHTNCGMVNLLSKKEQIIQGLIENAKWTKEEAEKHFDSNVHFFEIDNEVDFVVNESKRLSEKYKSVLFVPMLYKVEDNLLYLVE